MRKKLICNLVVTALFVVMFCLCPVEAKSAPQAGGVLPNIDLQMPKDTVHRKYLGVSRGGLLKIPQIKAEIVIIEIFSMY